MTYKIDLKAEPFGTSGQGSITASCSRIIEVFGRPLIYDHLKPEDTDGKLSTEWIFKGEDGKVYTLYDWKATTLYDPDNSTPEQFRAMPEYNWHIGAETMELSDKFEEWLGDQL